MNGSESTASPLEAVAGTAGTAATEAFAQLASEKRLGILIALWEAYEPFETEHAVPFSELRRRVGIRDKGQFYYHLDRLEGHFVNRTEDGYALSLAGHQLVRTVIAGAGLEDESLDPTPVEHDCYICGSPTTIQYKEQRLFWTCTECAGLVKGDGYPDGILAGSEFDPIGLVDRTPEAILNAAWTGGLLHFGLGGVCDACHGPMDSWLHHCVDHDSRGLCSVCGWRYAAVARFRCRICKRNHEMVPWWLVVNHPAVVAFYYERGVPLQYDDGVEYQPRIELGLQANHEQELTSTDPVRVTVTVRYDGDELALTLDEELDVVDVTERSMRDPTPALK